MPVGSSLKVHAINATIRFIQGYRYLDRCGEALIKLENVLTADWITTETSPKSGNIKNDQLGMAGAFSSEAMTVTQTEFVSFEHFLDQTCKIYDTLWQTFEIKRINAPTLRVFAQRGFEENELQEASKYLMSLGICTPHPTLVRILGGPIGNLESVLVTEDDVTWNDSLVHRRRRLQSQVVRQERQPPFDERMLKRARQLGDRQRDAIQGLNKLRKLHPPIAPVAVQLDVEDSFETEFNADEFDLPTFLQQAWQWANSVLSDVSDLRLGGA